MVASISTIAIIHRLLLDADEGVYAYSGSGLVPIAHCTLQSIA